MANILDYLDWREDLTLAQDPFNEVDNLILAELSFVDFGGIVPGPGEGRAVPLWKAAEAYFAKTEGRPIDMGVLVPNQIPELLRRTAASPRFRDMKLNGFVDHLDTVKAEQFAALAAECGDGTVYLSFRGTDDTLAGWKEDFYLSCMREVPAQKMAVTYTEAMAHQYPRIKLRLGGHSKGGNLAVWAGVFCPTAVQRRIAAVWSNDGPGFHEDILSLPRHIRLAERIHTIVPKSSVVGMLLEHEEDYTVVDSSQQGLMQHDGFSWEVLGNHFVRLHSVTRQAQSDGSGIAGLGAGTDGGAARKICGQRLSGAGGLRCPDPDGPEGRQLQSGAAYGPGLEGSGQGDPGGSAEIYEHPLYEQPADDAGGHSGRNGEEPSAERKKGGEIRREEGINNRRCSKRNVRLCRQRKKQPASDIKSIHPL